MLSPTNNTYFNNKSTNYLKLPTHNAYFNYRILSLFFFKFQVFYK